MNSEYNLINETKSSEISSQQGSDSRSEKLLKISKRISLIEEKGKPFIPTSLTIRDHLEY